jgi:hypothetical protein
MAIEEEFSIEIPDKEADAIHSIDQAVTYILSQPDAHWESYIMGDKMVADRLRRCVKEVINGEEPFKPTNIVHDRTLWRWID